VETAAWITERRALLCALFCLLSLDADVRSRGVGGAPSPRGWALSFAFFLAALFSKAAAMSLPVVLLVLDVYPFGRSLKDGRVWRARAPFFLVAALFAVVAGAAQRDTGAALSWTDYGPLQRLVQGAYAPLFLLGKTLWPAGLSPLYELKTDFDPAAFPFSGAVVLFIALTVGAWRGRKRFPALVPAALCALAFLAPTSGIFQSGPQIVADRYSYFAFIGPVIAAGGGLYGLWRRGGLAVRLSGAAAVLVIGALSLLTWRQELYWRTPLSLWERAAALQPDSSVIRFNRGEALQDAGRWAEALDEYRAAFRLCPTMKQAAYNAAAAHQAVGDPRRAESFYRLTLWMDPENLKAYNNLGCLLLDEGRPREAAAVLRQGADLAARLAPGAGEAKLRLNLSRALAAEPKR
jgi:tetratricopeptide (TPR) repeat protein